MNLSNESSFNSWLHQVVHGITVAMDGYWILIIFEFIFERLSVFFSALKTQKFTHIRTHVYRATGTQALAFAPTHPGATYTHAKEKKKHEQIKTINVVQF